MDSEWLYWVLDAARSELQSLGQGTTFSELSRSKLDDLRLAVPCPSEQAAIARFLDHATNRIDRYIRAKEMLIALLDEEKATFINQAVTGQVDVRTGKRFATYKRSGFNWLGEMPEHWQMVRNSRLFAQRNETGHPELPILEVSLRSGVRVRDLESPGRKQVMSDRSLYKRATKGDITYNMMRMWQGAVGAAPTDGLVSPAYVVAKPMPGIESRYFDHLFHTASYMSEVDKYSRGIVKDRNRLYWEDFKQMPTPCPPPHEQAEIANHIENHTAKANACIRNTRRQIGFASEHRKRLITDAVTGKLDVRRAGADLNEKPLAEAHSH